MRRLLPDLAHIFHYYMHGPKGRKSETGGGADASAGPAGRGDARANLRLDMEGKAAGRIDGEHGGRAPDGWQWRWQRWR